MGKWKGRARDSSSYQAAKEQMERAMKLSVPLVVETKVGKNWGEMKS